MDLELTDLEILFILQNVLRKVQHQDALQISDVVMASLLRMFQSTAGSGGVQEDALMAVSTLVEGERAANPRLCTRRGQEKVTTSLPSCQPP